MGLLSTNLIKTLDVDFVSYLSKFKSLLNIKIAVPLGLWGTATFLLAFVHFLFFKSIPAADAVTGGMIFISSLLHGGFYLSLLLLLYSPIYLFKKNTLKNMAHGVLFLICFWYYIAYLLYSYQNIHFSYYLKVLRRHGFSTFADIVRDSGVSALSFIILGLTIVFLFAMGFYWGHLRKLFSFIKIKSVALSYRLLLGMLLLCFLGIVSEQGLRRVEQKTFPSYVLLFYPKKSLVQFQAQLSIKEVENRFNQLENLIQQKKKLATLLNPPPPIFLFVIETFRRDVLTPKYTPHLHKMGQEGHLFKNSVAAANATHYGWFAIMHSQLPLPYHSFRKQKRKVSSFPLNWLKLHGYELHLLTAADLSYYEADGLIFGEEAALFHKITKADFEQLDSKRDLFIMNKLNAEMSSLKANKSKVFVTFLNSPHFPYDWQESIKPALYKPYLARDRVNSFNLKHQRHLLKNRYYNSVSYVDHLMGEFFKKLKQANLDQEAVVIVTGDHGEEFFEQSLFGHAGSHRDEALEVPIIFKLPGKEFVASDGFVSHFEVMPSLLDYLKLLSPEVATLLYGKSLLQPEELPSLGFITGIYGVNAPYLYILKNQTHKLLVEFPGDQPLEANTLYLNQIFDHNEDIFVPGSGSLTDYRKWIKNEFGSVLERELGVQF